MDLSADAAPLFLINASDVLTLITGSSHCGDHGGPRALHLVDVGTRGMDLARELLGQRS